MAETTLFNDFAHFAAQTAVSKLCHLKTLHLCPGSEVDRLHSSSKVPSVRFYMESNCENKNKKKVIIWRKAEVAAVKAAAKGRATAAVGLAANPATHPVEAGPTLPPEVSRTRSTIKAGGLSPAGPFPN